MYVAKESRYQTMSYRRCGQSGLMLPEITLGLWQSFDQSSTEKTARDILTAAFDLGVTHFDVANNYGVPPGSAETMLGRVLRTDLAPHRNELVISTKAGWTKWPGPYGDHGSRKYLVTSCDESLKRTGLDYFDIFYHHRPDRETPLIETMTALDYLVRSGKTLYVGLSNYEHDEAIEAFGILRALGTPCLIHQPVYSMFEREPEEGGVLDVCSQNGVGVICYAPLAGGLLTDRYLNGVPSDSRASRNTMYLKTTQLTPEMLTTLRGLNDIAAKRGQTLAQMSLSWVLRHDIVASALIGASRVSQLEDCVKAAGSPPFSEEELRSIDAIIMMLDENQRKHPYPIR